MLNGGRCYSIISGMAAALHSGSVLGYLFVDVVVVVCFLGAILRVHEMFLTTTKAASGMT